MVMDGDKSELNQITDIMDASHHPTSFLFSEHEIIVYGSGSDVDVLWGGIIIDKKRDEK